jgi:hypothetical protein
MSQPANPFIVFPSDLLELSGELAFPQIEFTVQEDKAGGNTFTSIYLPMPNGVSFTDGGSYDSMELGDIAAGGGMDALARLMQGDVGGAASAAGGTVEQRYHSLTGARGKAILASILPGVDKETAMFAQKKVKPPNQNTTFKGNNMRSFNFSFKLIANSERDTNAIARIQRTFRRYTYAGSSDDAPNVVLDYPPLWKIRFLEGDRENKYLPKIFACYLESFQCTFNDDANMFRYDGSPFSVGCQLSFKETRVLTRNDIDLLEMGMSNRGIDEKTGLATSAAPAGIKIPLKPYIGFKGAVQTSKANVPSGSPGQFPSFE